MIIRKWQPIERVSEITQMVRAAYKELADMGLQYVATWQDDAITESRLAKGTSFLAIDNDRVVGTITLMAPGEADGCEWYARTDVYVFSQFAVAVDRRWEGIGSRLLAEIESLAAKLGAKELACDTAESASHLIALYERKGYRIVERARWPRPNYHSVVLSKSML